MTHLEQTEKNGLGKYFIAGIIFAVLVYILIFFILGNDERDSSKSNVWSAETDSVFVKNCYAKYKPQVRDDLVKQESSKAFCRCMLEKIKARYEEQDMNKVTDSEIKLWDSECRNLIKNPDKINID